MSTNEIDTQRTAAELTVLPPAQPVHTAAQVMLRAQVAMMNDCIALADVVCRTNAVPERYRGKPQEAVAAMMFGAEVGLKPLVALQKVINVHGMPGLEARTMKGILKEQGFRFRTVTKTADTYHVYAWYPDSPVVLGTDPDDPLHYQKRILPDEESLWTIERARVAGYAPVIDPKTGEYKTFNKKAGGSAVVGNMKYITEPHTMLEAKGTADVCRTIAPEVLMGMPYSAEELQTQQWDDDDSLPAHPVRRTGGGGVNRLRDRAREAKASKAAADEANTEDAEVVPDDEATAPAETTPPPADDTTPADSDDTAPPLVGSADDLPMTAEHRKKGTDLMHALFGESGVIGKDDRAGRLMATQEIIAGLPGAEHRTIASSHDLSNRELKYLVDTMRAAQESGELNALVGNALNDANLREAGML